MNIFAMFYANSLDAKRYRYLRNRSLDTISTGGVFAGKIPENKVLNGIDLDLAVDKGIYQDYLKSQRGFSLLELLVVCGILAALGGLGLQALDQAPEFARQHQHLFVSPALHPAALPVPSSPGAHPSSQLPAEQGVDLARYIQ